MREKVSCQGELTTAASSVPEPWSSLFGSTPDVNITICECSIDMHDGGYLVPLQRHGCRTRPSRAHAADVPSAKTGRGTRGSPHGPASPGCRARRPAAATRPTPSPACRAAAAGMGGRSPWSQLTGNYRGELQREERSHTNLGRHTQGGTSSDALDRPSPGLGGLRVMGSCLEPACLQLQAPLLVGQTRRDGQTSSP